MISTETIFAAGINDEEASYRPKFVYTDKQAYIEKVLAAESSPQVEPFGEVFKTFDLKSGQAEIRRICLTNVHFSDQNIYL